MAQPVPGHDPSIGHDGASPGAHPPAPGAGVPPVVAAVASGAAEPMLIVDGEATVAYANQAAEELFGDSPERLEGERLTHLIHGLEGPVGEAITRRFPPVRDSEVTQWEGPSPLIVRSRRHGTPCAVRISSVEADGRRFACVSVRTDSAKLTGGRVLQLSGRRRVERALERTEGGAAKGLIVIDLDHFQLVNESAGRTAADLVLRRTEALLAARCGDRDLCCRLDGDRFAIVVRGASTRAQELTPSLLEAVREERFTAGGRRMRLTASAGIVTFSTPPRSGELALMEGETALRDAKEAGRDRSRSSSQGLRESRGDAVGVAEQVQSGVESGGLYPHFQPILDLGSDKISHYELLARMRGPSDDTARSASFIPIAERLGIIGQIDRWAIGAAISALVNWPDPKLRVAINLSGYSMDDRALLAELKRGLTDNGIDPARLIVELTETAAITSMEAAQEFGDELRELGVDFALDDFGSGFGTFYYLKHLPLSHVKIDGEFIHGIARSASDQLLVRSLVDIARSFQIRTVAEFVGDVETLDCVRDIGLDFAQGFFIGEPAPLPLAPPRRLDREVERS